MPPVCLSSLHLILRNFLKWRVTYRSLFFASCQKTHTHTHTHTHTYALWAGKQAAYLQGSDEPRAPTLRVLVGVGNVLPLISAHALCADLLPHDQGVVDGLVHGPIILPDPVHHVGVDLGKDERGIVLGAQVAHLDGTNGNRATAVCPWLGVGGG